MTTTMHGYLTCATLVPYAPAHITLAIIFRIFFGIKYILFEDLTVLDVHNDEQGPDVSARSIGKKRRSDIRWRAARGNGTTGQVAT